MTITHLEAFMATEFDKNVRMVMKETWSVSETSADLNHLT
jgi:uncharacterized protein YcgI (DUF1989 family)